MSDSASCVAHVEIVRAVKVSISPEYQENLHDGTLNYAVTITNAGTVDDNYDLAVRDNENWSLSIAPSIMVPAFENRTTTLTVVIPGDAVGCTEDNIIVTFSFLNEDLRFLANGLPRTRIFLFVSSAWILFLNLVRSRTR